MYRPTFWVWDSIKTPAATAETETSDGTGGRNSGEGYFNDTPQSPFQDRDVPPVFLAARNVD